MRGLVAYVVSALTGIVPLALPDGHRVTVLCDQPEHVANQRLRIVRHDEPMPLQSTSTLLKTAPVFDRRGRCEVRLDAGRYRFDVLTKSGSTQVALSTGLTRIDSDGERTIQVGKPATVRLLDGSKVLRLDQVRFGIPGTLEGMTWDAGPAGPEVMLSPDRDFPARILARGRSQEGPVHVMLWTQLKASRLDLDLSAWDGWLSRAKFRWLGDAAGRGRIRNPTATFHLPEGDELEIPIEPGTRLVTNRRFIEMSYSYETAAGERLVFSRRSRLLSREHTIPWGGPLTEAAYARVAMKWAKPGRSLLWGAYLHNGEGDVVSLNEFPPEKSHRRTESGHPTYLSYRQPFSKIDWKQTLHRIDGGPVPRDLENLSTGDLERIGDINRMHENYLVAVSYVLDGKQVEKNVPLSRFVTWKSKHTSLEAPVHWGGRPAAYLDKMERIHAICQPLGRYTPDFIQLFWTNNYGAGYTIGPRSKKRIQMGFFDLRDRKGLYSLPDILIHEVLHAFGHGHGRGHNEAIGAARRIFERHRAYLAGRPDYAPEPVVLDYSIEDTRNHGAGNHDAFTRHAVPRDEGQRRTGSGPFRGHTPKVESEKEALSKYLSLKEARPLPARWEDALDLLKPVDPSKHAVHGRWLKLDGQLVSSSKPYARVQLAAIPEGSYQFETQFTRVGGDCMALMLPVGGTSVLLVVSGWKGKVSGLAFIRGRDADRNKTTRDGALANGRKHTLFVKVLLLDDDRARIEVTLNGKAYLDWEGPRSDLKPDRQWSLKKGGLLGLGAYNAVIVFHSCQLKGLK